MTTLDGLPDDQHAVLQLVLQRARSYDQIAQLLSIERDVVRRRALDALDALGPDTRVPVEQRTLITDYLLGQLSGEESENARKLLADSGSARAWARVVSSELAPLASSPLPEIPVEQASREPHAESEPAAATASSGPPPEPAAADAASHQARPASGQQPEPSRRSSRTGGAILLGAGALVAIAVVAVVIVLVVNSGGSSKGHTNRAAASTTTSATTTSANTSGATPLAAVRLLSPTHSKKTLGFAEVVKQGGKTGVVIVAQGVPANSTHDAYAVWLYNSPSDSHILGFVNPPVKTDGKLQTAGVLPANAAHFRQMLVTLETRAKPQGPGKIVLQGPFKIQ